MQSPELFWMLKFTDYFYTSFTQLLFQATVIYCFEKYKFFDVWMFQRQCNCIIHHCSNIYIKMLLII